MDMDLDHILLLPDPPRDTDLGLGRMKREVAMEKQRSCGRNRKVTIKKQRRMREVTMKK